MYAFSTRFGVSRSPSRAGSSPRSVSSFLIASCILLFYISAAAAQPPDPAARERVSDADGLYADRANLASARRAAAIWSSALAADPRNAEAAWKLARTDYWLGNHAPESERRGFLETGIDAGRRAAALLPNRPEGHFWMAASMGAFLLAAGTKGKRFALPNANIMIHQVLGGAEGQASDVEIRVKYMLKLKQRLNTIISKHTGQTYDTVEKACDRDNFMSAEEAKKFGLVDEVVASRKEVPGLPEKSSLTP